MVQSGKLSERQRQCIYIQKMQGFLQSDIAKRMSIAATQGKLHKEQSFFLGVSANMVKPEFTKEETMLVQGIIDAYFEEDGELVLVDYKTDRVEQGRELIERYHVQMEYYTKALEQALGKKVKEVVLYSLSLEQEVRLR
jgi:ATP-dependent helicase/nuclease subunit A